MDSIKNKYDDNGNKIKVKDENRKKSWLCAYNVFSVALIAFGISSLMFLPDYIHKQIMSVS